MYKLDISEYNKVTGIITNSMSELAIESGLYGYTPIEVYVDCLENPEAGLIKEEDSNILFGKPNTSKDFYWQIFEKIDYYEGVTCDNKAWHSVVEEHHHNRAIRSYTRYTYHLKKEDYLECKKKLEGIEIKLLNIDDIKKLDYENSEVVKEWVTLQNIDSLPGLKLAAIVVKDNVIVSCSCVDYYYNNRIEIGINTNKKYRGKGYGIVAANELVKELLDYGIEEIGWHCVSTNRGSRRIAEKLGFKRTSSYRSFRPQHFIENISDLTLDEWIDNAHFYIEKASQDPAQYWMAAHCWACANRFNEVFNCLVKLIENDVKWILECLEEDWFLNNIRDIDEYNRYKSIHRWDEKLFRLCKTLNPEELNSSLSSEGLIK